MNQNSSVNSGDNRISGEREDQVTSAIEAQTAKIPSSAFLWAALGFMGLSAILQSAGKNKAALFVGQWPAPFLLMGLYNKLVKQLGSDAESREEGHGLERRGSIGAGRQAMATSAGAGSSR